MSTDKQSEDERLAEALAKLNSRIFYGTDWCAWDKQADFIRARWLEFLAGARELLTAQPGPVDRDGLAKLLESWMLNPCMAGAAADVAISYLGAQPLECLPDKGDGCAQDGCPCKGEPWPKRDQLHSRHQIDLLGDWILANRPEAIGDDGAVGCAIRLLGAQPGPVACEPLTPSRNVLAGMLREWRSRSSLTPHEMADELLKLLAAPQEAQPAPTADHPFDRPDPHLGGCLCSQCKQPAPTAPAKCDHCKRDCGGNCATADFLNAAQSLEAKATAPAKTATPAIENVIARWALDDKGRAVNGEPLNIGDDLRAAFASDTAGLRAELAERQDSWSREGARIQNHVSDLSEDVARLERELEAAKAELAEAKRYAMEKCEETGRMQVEAQRWRNEAEAKKAAQPSVALQQTLAEVLLCHGCFKECVPMFRWRSWASPRCYACMPRDERDASWEADHGAPSFPVPANAVAGLDRCIDAAQPAPQEGTTLVVSATANQNVVKVLPGPRTEGFYPTAIVCQSDEQAAAIADVLNRARMPATKEPL